MNYSIEIKESKINEKTLVVNNLFLHSKYNPSKEAENIADANYKPHYLHILFGYGLGYIAERLLKRFKFNEPLLIVDPLIDQGYLQYDTNLSNRLYYCNSQNKFELSNTMSNLMSYSSKVTVIVAPNYKNLFTSELYELLQIVKESQEREVLNLNTVGLFAQDWQLNILMNLQNMNSDSSVEELFGKYDFPVVVASGGPSLIKQIPLLKEYRERFILISAGSTTNSLLKHGVSPDYVVSIDGGEPNWNHFKDGTYKCDIVYAPINHYKIRNQFTGNGYYFIPEGLNSLELYYDKKFNIKIPSIYGGASVAHYAYSIAKKITSNAICLIGQDLAYTNNQSHADGNKGNISLEEDFREIQMVDGYFGEPVESNSSFKAMKHNFEQLNIINPHSNKTYNCTEGGAKINYFDQISFKEFLESYCLHASNCTKYNNQKTNQLFESFEDIINQEFENYDRIIELLEKGIKITEKEKGPLFKQQTLKELNKIEKRLNKLYIEFNVDSLMEPAILKNEHKFLPAENESNLEAFNRVKNYTIELYSDCKKQLQDFIELLKKEGIRNE